MDSPHLFIQASAMIQCLFTVAAGVDALWFHFAKFRLHARGDTRTEHLLHTFNACLFPFTVYFLYCGNFGGRALWIGIAATLATFGLEFVDVAHERKSRAALGGLPAAEAVMHFGMGVARALAFAFALAAKPVEAFSPWASPVSPGDWPSWVVAMGRAMFAASLPMAALHVFLCFRRKEEVDGLARNLQGR